jgi:hypothetical protein
VKEINAIDKDSRFILPNVGRAKGLTHTSGGGDGVGIHHADLETIGKTPRDESVM